ncbi:tripartite motif-containing protein 5 [Patella vulgata]|uniref:tripartite motif-containing protein 5 n=1 Tax=Patella vulgata TaxID=6465 RepID=UPI0024A9417A|nr:tripartite motif-containing protein 5 [Patella vulgata]
MAELTNKFDCHICLHYFTNPKIIDCFHSFCKSCLEDYVRKYVSTGEFPCPLCRKSIRIPFGGVDKFPCNLCIEDDKETSSFSSCQQHKKERDLYCSLCNIPICTKCLTSSHQGHLLRNVEDIEEETREELEFVHANLKERLAELKTLRSNIKKEKKKLRPSLEADINNVDKQKEQINQHVENEGMEIKSELEASYKIRELSLSQLKRDADEAIKKLEILTKETPSVWLKDRLEEMMTMIPDVREKMAEVKRLKLPEDALCLVFKEGEIQKRSLSGMLGQLQNGNSTGSNTQKNRF